MLNSEGSKNVGFAQQNRVHAGSADHLRMKGSTSVYGIAVPVYLQAQLLIMARMTLLALE